MRPVTNYCPDQKKFTLLLNQASAFAAIVFIRRKARSAPLHSTSPAPRFLLSGASGMLGTALREVPDRAELLCSPAGPFCPHSSQPAPVGPRRRLRHSLTLRALKTSPPPSISPAPTLPPTAGHPITSAKSPKAASNSTRALATTLAGLRHPPQTLLVASATGIYGNRGDELLDETSLPGTGFLADLCQRMGSSRPARRRCRHPRSPSPLRCRPRPRPRRPRPDAPHLPPRPRWPSRQRPSVHELDLAPRRPRRHPLPARLSESLRPRQPHRPQPRHQRPIYPHPRRPSSIARPFSLSLPSLFASPSAKWSTKLLLSSARAYPARLAAAGFQFAYPSLIHALPAVLHPDRS